MTPARRRAAVSRRPRAGADATLARCVNLDDLEALAKRRLPRPSYDYYAGGAEDERTVARNRAAYDRFVFLRRVLVGVGEVRLATTLLGAPVAMPVALAPTAFHRLAHRDGERATARAAHAAGTLMTLSTMSTTTLEDVATASAGPKWFQLYVYRDRALSERLVARAERAGFRALVLTVDTPRLGRRERDARNRFALPKGMPLANFIETGDQGSDWGGHGSMAAYANAQIDPTLTWEAVEWLRRMTRLPIVLKGIVHPDDAARGVEAGAAAIWVSNHGGRQLDSEQAPLLALPAVARAVAGGAEVYVDGGIRRGTDVLKALALGARAAFVGRAQLWGLAAGGQAGVARMLEMLRVELGSAMAIAGVTDVARVPAELVVPS